MKKSNEQIFKYEFLLNKFNIYVLTVLFVLWKKNVASMCKGENKKKKTFDENGNFQLNINVFLWNSLLIYLLSARNNTILTDFASFSFQFYGFMFYDISRILGYV